jgi:hypothetical protein
MTNPPNRSTKGAQSMLLGLLTPAEIEEVVRRDEALPRLCEGELGRVQEPGSRFTHRQHLQ